MRRHALDNPDQPLANGTKMIDWAEWSPPDPQSEADFASLRNLGRTTVGKSFTLRFGSSADVGFPARTVWQVISEESKAGHGLPGDEDEVTLHESPHGRVQVKARIVRDRGRVTELRFERVTGRANHDARIDSLLNLDGAAAGRLIDLCLALKGIDPSGTETLKFDEDLLAAVMADPAAAAAAYDRDPSRFQEFIQSDKSAKDVIALAARREALQRFEDLLDDPSEFEAARGGGGSEAVWQRFFEENPWLLGVGLAGQLLTSWDPTKLEKTVGGSTVADAGKRVDALLTTSGIVRSMVLAEFKRHDDDLLDPDYYRSGCWAPSPALTSGVAQAHTTADRARDDLGTWLASRDDDGYRTGEEIYAGAPRSFLVIGSLGSLTRGEQLHPGKVRSFELYRRHLSYPEIVTYDEVLERARWTLELADSTAALPPR